MLMETQKLTTLLNKYSALMAEDDLPVGVAFFLCISLAYSMCLREEKSGLGKAGDLFRDHIENTLKGSAFAAVFDRLKLRSLQ